jgi:hypothetical protein
LRGHDGESITREYESVINRVSGVNAAKILTDSEGNITEIHVLATNYRSPKQIVRDIESAIVAKYGSEIDHKKISVAQIEDKTVKESQGRLRLLSVNVKTSGPSTYIEVELADGSSNIYRGSANGANSSANRLRLVAKATLNAIREVKEDYGFAVEDIAITELAKKDAVVVAVMAVNGSGEELLTGVAIAKKDVLEAVVRATLDSLNRRILLA